MGYVKKRHAKEIHHKCGIYCILHRKGQTSHAFKPFNCHGQNFVPIFVPLPILKSVVETIKLDK